MRRGISGFVRNLPDGRVEVWAQADRETLTGFRTRLQRGPSAARVDEVEATPVAVDASLSGFETRY